MRYHKLLACVAMALAIGASAADRPDPLDARKQRWQTALEKGSLRDESRKRTKSLDTESRLLSTLSEFSGDCQVHMIYDPATTELITFKFMREGKEIVAIDGHMRSVFGSAGNILYFPQFPLRTPGCTMMAYDLTTGKKLWETKLSALGNTPEKHIAKNFVFIGFSSREIGLASDEKDEIVYVMGDEQASGRYVEILDRNTGIVLARKILSKITEREKSK